MKSSARKVIRNKILRIYTSLCQPKPFGKLCRSINFIFAYFFIRNSISLFFFSFSFASFISHHCPFPQPSPHPSTSFRSVTVSPTTPRGHPTFYYGSEPHVTRTRKPSASLFSFVFILIYPLPSFSLFLPLSFPPTSSSS